MEVYVAEVYYENVDVFVGVVLECLFQELIVGVLVGGTTGCLKGFD